MIRLSNGGRLDFWSLENPIAGRGRGYQRVVIDEAAFTKNGDNRSDDSMMALWEKGIKPTLFDYGGEALVCSNSAGKNPDNFFYNICTDPQYGFHEFHATTMDNPLLPKRARNESHEAWLARRAQFHEDLRKDNDPLVYAQEYLAEFVDWSGVAFFSREKLLVDNRPLPLPARCDAVFAVIDTASKTGTDNDATAVTFFALDRIGRIPLLILDWDIVQIEGALLETWLPEVFARLEELARLCRARSGSIGAFIEDKNSGTILLQQALRRQCPRARSTRSSPRWARTSERFPCPATCIASWSSTRTAPSTRRSSTSDAHEITCSTKSRAFGLATETATARTTFSTPSATASRWRLGIAKASDLSLLSNDRRAAGGGYSKASPRASRFESPQLHQEVCASGGSFPSTKYLRRFGG